MGCVNEGNLFWISLMDTFQHTLIPRPLLLCSCPYSPFLSSCLSILAMCFLGTWSPKQATCHHPWLLLIRIHMNCSLKCADVTLEMISHLVQVLLWPGYFLCSTLLFNWWIEATFSLQSLIPMSVCADPGLYFLTQVGNLRTTPDGIAMFS